MCYFLAVGVPERFVAALSASTPAGFRLEPVANPPVRRHLAPRAAFWARSPGSCECALYLGLTVPGPAGEEQASAFRRRRQRAGWASAKIERALAASQAARQQQTPAREIGWAWGFGAWMGKAASAAGEVAIVAHMFEGLTEEEEGFALTGSLVITPDELEPGRARLPLDVLVRIVHPSVEGGRR